MANEDDLQDEFEREAEGSQRSLPAEFAYFLMENKKWWLTPIIVCLLLLAALVILSGTAAGPFIYTIF